MLAKRASNERERAVNGNDDFCLRDDQTESSGFVLAIIPFIPLRTIAKTGHEESVS